MIARGFGFEMVVSDTALEEDDVSRKGDTIAVLMAVRREKNLDGRDRPHTTDMLLEKKMIPMRNPRRSLMRRCPGRLISIDWHNTTLILR